MAHRSEFYLYKRRKKKSSYWYVCYLDRDTGKQGNAKSIDVLKERLGLWDFRSVKRRDEAVIIAKKALDSGLVFQDRVNILFADYCLDFWNFDTSEYIKLRNTVKPGSIGREYALNMGFFLRKHVIRYLPEGLRLQNVQTRHLDAVISGLSRDANLASGTLQLISLSFTLPLKEAYRSGLIYVNPADRMMKIIRSEKSRGFFSAEECSTILSYLANHRAEIFPSYYYAVVLALCTGMRSGEIRALNMADIQPSKFDGLYKIVIRHSLSPYSGLKGTKGKYERAVLIPETLEKELEANADENGIVIPSKWGGYISSPTLRNFFYEILDKIGITETEREERNLTFHSLRHSFSTLGRDNQISQEDRMLVLGHKSKEVNDRYTHISEDALYRVSGLTDRLFSIFENGVSVPPVAENKTAALPVEV